MSGYGNLAWKSPRRPACIDCGAIFETRGTNTPRCLECRKVRRRAKWRDFNRKRADRKRPVEIITPRGPCECCKAILHCRKLVRTQAPILCQAGDRRRLKWGEIERLGRIPAAYLGMQLTDLQVDLT